MTIVSLITESAGVAGILPRIGQMKSTDILSTIMMPGYINNSPSSQGISMSNGDILAVNYNNGSGGNTSELFEINIPVNSSIITLTLAGSGAIDGTANEIIVTHSSVASTISIAPNAILPGTGALTLPAGTTGEQTSPSNGIRYNSESGNYELYVASAWQIIDVASSAVTSITGTEFEITVSSSTGNVTLSFPDQMIAPNSLQVTNTLNVNDGSNTYFLASSAGVSTQFNVLDDGSGNIITLGNITIGTNATGATLSMPVSGNDLYSPNIVTSSVGGFSLTTLQSDSFAFDIDQFAGQNFSVNYDGSAVFTVDGLGNGAFIGGGSLTIPFGNTGSRPGSPMPAMMRYNEDAPGIEYYNSYFNTWNYLMPVSVINAPMALYGLGYNTSVTASSNAIVLGYQENVGIAQANPLYSLDIANTFNGAFGGACTFRMANSNNLPATPANAGDLVFYNENYLWRTLTDTAVTSEVVQANDHILANNASYSVAVHDYIIGANPADDPITITLPAANNVTPGRPYYVKDESGQAVSNPIAIATADSSNIDGGSGASINAAYGSAGFYSNGIQWFTI